MPPIDVRAWQQPGATGFFAFLADYQPMVPGPKGKFVPFALLPREESELRAALDGPYRTLIFCWPRRHGKTIVSALLVIHRFLTSKNRLFGLIANSKTQAVGTAFKSASDILTHTPYSAGLIKSRTIQIQGEKILYDGLGNVIQGFTASPATLYGKKLAIAQISELHAAVNDEAYQVVASATVDTSDALVLVDSTVGPKSSPLYALYQLAQKGTDPTLFYSHISYRDLEEACRQLPPWITEDSLRSRAEQMLPAEFAQQHLNLWTSGSNNLFSPEMLLKCAHEYPLNAKAITNGAPHAVGGGLDRAVGFSKHGDATVTTAVLKVLQGEEEHFYVLASDKITFSSAGGIKNALKRYEQEHGMARACIESFNSQDIAEWCGLQKFQSETVNATAQAQASTFTHLYNIANEGRLHIHPSFEKLHKELAEFTYWISRDSNNTQSLPKFEAAKGSKDDHVYSLAWAIYSLRENELNPYEIAGIHCFGPSVAVRQCSLNGGEAIPPCSDSCRSMAQAHAQYRTYQGRAHLVPLPFPAFIRHKLTNTGSHTTPR